MSASLQKLLRGEERAYRVFWYWGGGVLFALSMLSLLVDIALPQLSGVMLVLYDAACALWAVAMWRSAFNEAHHFWGYVFRFLAVIMLLSVLADVPGVGGPGASAPMLSTNDVLKLAMTGGLSDVTKECVEELKIRQGNDASSLEFSACLMREVQKLQSQQ